MDIRQATDSDWPGIWEIFRDVVASGDTYPYAPDTHESEAKKIWIANPQATYVAIEDGEDGQIIGTYYLKPNQAALGSHVCNAGYMVAQSARKKGLGRAMCEHSLKEARRLGFRAMQYNLVVASNENAVKLWKKMGFREIGVIPQAFQHASLGYVDALIMYRDLMSPDGV